MMYGHTEVWTDGACIRNGSEDAAGGMGIFAPDLDLHKAIPWYSEDTVPTNQRCELLAAIIALRDIGGDVIIHTDSEYMVRGMNEWVTKWMENGWKNARRKEVKHVDLWKKLVSLCANRDVVFRHVRGHSGDYGNEKADKLAYSAAVQHEMSNLAAFC